MSIFYVVSGFLGIGILGPLALYILYLIFVKTKESSNCTSTNKPQTNHSNTNSRQHIIEDNNARSEFLRQKYRKSCSANSLSVECQDIDNTQHLSTEKCKSKGVNKLKRWMDQAFQLEHSGKLKEAIQMYYKVMSFDENSAEGKEAKSKYYELTSELKCNEAERSFDDTAGHDRETSRQDLLDKYRNIANQHNKIINKSANYTRANVSEKNSSYTPPYPTANKGGLNSTMPSGDSLEELALNTCKLLFNTKNAKPMLMELYNIVIESKSKSGAEYQRIIYNTTGIFRSKYMNLEAMYVFTISSRDKTALNKLEFKSIDEFTNKAAMDNVDAAYIRGMSFYKETYQSSTNIDDIYLNGLWTWRLKSELALKFLAYMPHMSSNDINRLYNDSNPIKTLDYATGRYTIEIISNFVNSFK